MMHSMDFHAAMVSPQDKYRSIAPGQTITFEFTPNYPGVFMYHCGTPMVLEHIASGMYGAVIVEPREGYPTKVDREYAVIQSEFYTKPDPDKHKVDGAPAVRAGRRARPKAPTHTVFNGALQRHGREAPPRKIRERVRMFVLNVGPRKTSSFHVVGTIFDRVWLEGNPDNQFRGVQTVLLGVEQRDRRIHDSGGRYLHHGGPSFRQCFPGRDRLHARCAETRRDPNTTICRPRPRQPSRPRSQGQAGLRKQSASPATPSPGAASSAPILPV